MDWRARANDAFGDQERDKSRKMHVLYMFFILCWCLEPPFAAATVREERPLRIRLFSTRVFDCHSQIRGSQMRYDRKIDVSFSARAEDYLQRFMKVAERTRERKLSPNYPLVDRRNFHEQSNGRGDGVRARC